MPDAAAPDALAPPAVPADDELVDTVLAASRALVAVAARSLAAAGNEVTLPQYGRWSCWRRPGRTGWLSWRRR
jgi:hypothetical protein